MNMIVPVFAYLSPETCLPLTSILATTVGVVLMFGRGTLAVAMRWLHEVRAAFVFAAENETARGLLEGAACTDATAGATGSHALNAVRAAGDHDRTQDGIRRIDT